MSADPQLTTISLAEVDVDGALREAAGRLPTRVQFLRRGVGALAGGAVVAGLLPAGAGASARGSAAARNDEAILNFALALEYLQAAFYSEAERVGALRGALADQARVVGSHERAHVKALRAQLGGRAIHSPRFDFHGATDGPVSFRANAVAFEDLAVGAYKQQLPLIRSDRYLAAAVAIQSVEGRHAAWIRRLAGVLPAESAFDEPISVRRTVQLVNSTRFVTLAQPRTSANGAPRFTG